MNSHIDPYIKSSIHLFNPILIFQTSIQSNLSYSFHPILPSSIYLISSCSCMYLYIHPIHVSIKFSRIIQCTKLYSFSNMYLSNECNSTHLSNLVSQYPPIHPSSIHPPGHPFTHSPAIHSVTHFKTKSKLSPIYVRKTKTIPLFQICLRFNKS